MIVLSLTLITIIFPFRTPLSTIFCPEMFILGLFVPRLSGKHSLVIFFINFVTEIAVRFADMVFFYRLWFSFFPEFIYSGNYLFFSTLGTIVIFSVIFWISLASVWLGVWFNGRYIKTYAK